MKKLTFLLSLCIGCQVAIAQSFFNSLEVTAAQADYAYDTRFFEFPLDRDLSSLRYQRGSDRQYAFGINTNLFTYQSWSVYVGLGYTKETNSVQRPFDHCLFTENCGYNLRFTDTYENELLLFPVEVRYDIFPTKKYSIVLNLQFLPSWNFYKTVNTPGGGTPFEKSVSEFYSMEVNPGVGVRFLDRFSFNMHYRAWQLKNIDEVIFYGILFDNFDAPDNKFETYNPRKMWLSLRYKLFRFN